MVTRSPEKGYKRQADALRAQTRESDALDEYDAWAGWCARGGAPEGLSREARRLIARDPDAFQARVEATAYAIARDGSHRAALERLVRALVVEERDPLTLDEARDEARRVLAELDGN